MSAGQLIHIVRLLIPVTADDGEGGQSVTWTDGPKLFANIRPVSAREQALAGAVQTLVTHMAAMHFDSRVTVKRRFERIWPAGPTLEILGVQDPDGHQRHLEVDCAEVV